MVNPNNADRAKLALVCVGAGRGLRFGSNKLVAELGRRTVLETSLAALRTAVPDSPMVVVVAPEAVEDWREILAPEIAITEVIAGGSRRQDSVRLGVEWAARADVDVVAVHDAARPLVHPDDIRRLIDAMGEASAAILVAKVSDTVKQVDQQGIIRATIDRRDLRMAQTPQVCRVAALEAAWRRQDWSREWSDEAALLEADSCEVRTLAAEHPNPKITTADDLRLARLLVGDQS